jgi:dipeptidyl aminopeptidase/acylaminoacyl peptidase
MGRYYPRFLAIALSVTFLATFDNAQGNEAKEAVTATKSWVDPYVKDHDLQDIVLSPSGDYFAATLPLENRRELVIIRRSDMKVTGRVGLIPNKFVDGFFWGASDRVVFEVADSSGYRGGLISDLTVYGINVDGKGQGPIGGLSKDSTDTGRATSIKQVDRQPTWLIGRVPSAPGRALVRTIDIRTSQYQLALMDVRSGSMKRIHGFSRIGENVYYDRDAAVKISILIDSQNNQTTRVRSGANADWIVINNEKNSSQEMRMLGFNAANDSAYMSMSRDAGPDAIVKVSLTTGKVDTVFTDKRADPAEVLISPVNRGVYGVVLRDGFPRVHYLDPDDRHAKALRSLSATFKEDFVRPVSFTDDGNLGIYLVSSDRSPGVFYTFDLRTNELLELGKRNKSIDPSKSAITEPVELRTRDGLTVQAFVTYPHGADRKNLRMVVFPHGGPMGIYDTWEYEPEVQLMASRGFAVLRVNFRGSGGYGKAHELAGYKQWGRKMQDDLTDATRWAVESGIADPRRICIYGSSYGGYAALMGVIREPMLYRCAVGNIGVYDTRKVLNESGWSLDASRDYIESTLGDEDLNQISANKLAHKVQVPVLLFAGQEDQVAKVEHTEDMQKALLAAGKKSEMVIYPREGHGNFLLKNRRDFAERLIAFLEANTQ